MRSYKWLFLVLIIGVLTSSISPVAEAAEKFNPSITEVYGIRPLTAGPFPIDSHVELARQFAPSDPQIGVAQWLSMGGHIEWYDRFYMNLGKATLKRVPLETIAFWSEGTGKNVNITSYTMLRPPKNPSPEVAAWLKKHGGMVYWSVPIGDGVAIGVHPLCGNLFLTFGQSVDYPKIASSVASFTVSQTVTNNITINVGAPVQAPTPVVAPELPEPQAPVGACETIIANPAKFKDGEPVRFTARVRNATGYSWDFGDGTVDRKPDPSHVFNRPGSSRNRKSYTVTLTVRDEAGRESSCSLVLKRKGKGGWGYAAGGGAAALVLVGLSGGGGSDDPEPPAVNHPPSCSGVTVSPNSGPVGSAFTFTANATDPDGDPLSYLWSNGQSGRAITVTPTQSGSLSLSVTISDGRGGQTSCSGTATVSGGTGGCAYPPVNQVTFDLGPQTYVGPGTTPGTVRLSHTVMAINPALECLTWSITGYVWNPGKPDHMRNLLTAASHTWTGEPATGTMYKLDVRFQRPGDASYTYTKTYGPFTAPTAGANMTAQSESSVEKAEAAPKPRTTRVVDIGILSGEVEVSQRLSFGLTLGGTIFSGEGKVDVEPFALGTATLLATGDEWTSINLFAEGMTWPDRLDLRGGVAVVMRFDGPIQSVSLAGSYLRANATGRYDDDHIYGVADNGEAEDGWGVRLGLTFWENDASRFMQSFGVRLSIDGTKDSRHAYAGVGFSF